MKVLIIEDELMARRSLEMTLEKSFPEIEIVGECGSVRESVAWLTNHGGEVDTIFMDVELSDGVCFEIFRQIEVKANVVMTTAYDSYALKAFEAGSVDYLLKPIDPGPLARAVERCRLSNGRSGSDVEKILAALGKASPEKEYKERFLVQLNDRIVPVKTADVAFFYSEDKCNHVVTHDGTIYIIDNTLDSLITGLDPELFFRISRSCIVSKDSVESVTKLFGGRLKVASKVTFHNNPRPQPDLTVSRSRCEEFLTWLEK
ncbi:MAG: response regulator transcription factor [Bacteroidales bacterium]|nr:response regulator transcription factor [Bacteroidales bacterium]